MVYIHKVVTKGPVHILVFNASTSGIATDREFEKYICTCISINCIKSIVSNNIGIHVLARKSKHAVFLHSKINSYICMVVKLDT